MSSLYADVPSVCWAMQVRVAGLPGFVRVTCVGARLRVGACARDFYVFKHSYRYTDLHNHGFLGRCACSYFQFFPWVEWSGVEKASIGNTFAQIRNENYSDKNADTGLH